MTVKSASTICFQTFLSKQIKQNENKKLLFCSIFTLKTIFERVWFFYISERNIIPRQKQLIKKNVVKKNSFVCVKWKKISIIFKMKALF